MEINVYIILLVAIAIVTVFYALLFGGKSIRQDRRYLLIVLLIIFVFMIVREASVGIDSDNYRKIFNDYSNLDVVDFFSQGRHEIGYKLTNKIVYLLGGDFYTLMILISGFVIFSYYWFIKKYSTNYLLSISIFMGLDFFILSFGIWREAIAMSFVLFAIAAIIDKRPKKFCVLVLLGALFHYVALLFFPAYLLCKIKINKKTIIAWAILVVVLFFAKGLIIDFILENIYAPIGLEKNGLGTGGYVVLFLFLVLFVSALAMFYVRKKIIDRKIEVFVNVVMIGTVIQIFAVYYSLLYRVSVLFLVVAICLIPIMIEKIQKKKVKICLRIMMLMAMAGYYIYRAVRKENGFVDYALNQFAITIIVVAVILIVVIIIHELLIKREMKNMKEEILFLTSTLSSKGGAERVVVSLANWIAKNEKKYKPIIVVLDRKNSAYDIKDGVKVIQPDCDFSGNRVTVVLRRVIFCIKTIRKVKARYIVSFYSKMIFYAKIASTENNVLVGSERANPKIRSKIQRAIDVVAFRMCDRFIFQTVGAQRCFNDKYNKSIVIPNPINEKVKMVDDSRKEKRIIAVGRLSEQKGFDVLIDAFKRVSTKNPDYSLVIFGEGEKKDELLSQINRLCLEGKVVLMGRSDFVVREMSKSKIFVLSSRYEGMPNALIEAMASGVACISTRCDYGPSDLIKDGENGIMVDVGNVEQLAREMDYLIRDSKRRKMLAENAYEINDRLQAKRIYRNYVNYIVGGLKNE